MLRGSRMVGGTTLLVLMALGAIGSEPVKLEIPLYFAGPSARKAIRDAERRIGELTGGRLAVDLVTQRNRKPEGGGPSLTDAQQQRVGRMHSPYLLPGIIDSADSAKALRPSMKKDLEQQLQGSELVLLGVEQGAAARLLSTVPITHPADLQGLKLWMPPLGQNGGEMTNMVAGLGVKTVELEPAKVANALKSGDVDLVMMPIATAIALRWHHQLTHVLDLSLIQLSRPVVVKKDDLADVSPEDIEILTTVLGELLASLHEDARRMDSRSRRVLELQKVDLQAPGGTARQEWQQLFDSLASGMVEQGRVDADRLNRIKEALANTR